MRSEIKINFYKYLDSIRDSIKNMTIKEIIEPHMQIHGGSIKTYRQYLIKYRKKYNLTYKKYDRKAEANKKKSAPKIYKEKMLKKNTKITFISSFAGEINKKNNKRPFQGKILDVINGYYLVGVLNKEGKQIYKECVFPQEVVKCLA